MNKIHSLINWIIDNKKYHFWIFLIILILLAYIMNMDHYFGIPYFGDDFGFHYRRINALIDALKENTFPYYIDYHTLNGYGYFIKGFYSDFILIPFAAIGIYIGTDETYRFIIFVTTIISGILTYYSANKVYKNTFIAFLTAILYTFCYYKLCNNYNRAALAESLGMTFIPLILLGTYEIIKGDYKKWYILTIGFGLMVFSHIVIPILSFITLIIFLIIYRENLLKEPKRIYYLIFSGICTLFFSAYFMAPLIEQMNSNTFFYQDDTKSLSAIAVGMPFKVIVKGMFSGITDGPFGIGILLTWCISIRLFISRKEKNIKHADTILIVGFILMLMISPLYPWTIFPFNKFNFIQFSWRFYAIISFLFSISGSIYLHSILKNRRNRIYIGIPFVIIMTFFVIMFFSEKLKISNESKAISAVTLIPSPNNRYLIYEAGYLPNRIPNDYVSFFEERGKDSIKTNNNAHIDSFIKTNATLRFNISIATTDTLELPLLYYKGYSAYLNNKEIEVSQSENGLIKIPVNESGDIKVYYEGTTIQRISFWITIISIISLCVYIYIYNKKQKHNA